jgi:hypothetical protein
VLQQTVHSENTARPASFSVVCIFASLREDDVQAAALFFGQPLPFLAANGEHERGVDRVEDVAHGDAFQATDLDGPLVLSREYAAAYVEDRNGGIGCEAGEVDGVDGVVCADDSSGRVWRLAQVPYYRTTVAQRDCALVVL